MRIKRIVFVSTFLVLLAGLSFATPSTLIWNPSTDIQPFKAWHLGIDDYFSVVDKASGGQQAPTDPNLTYGLLPGLEVGVDAFLPQSNPGSSLVFNAKYGLPEKDWLPALAVGGYNFGLQANVTDQNILYGLGSKNFFFGRLTAGYFSGNRGVIGSDGNGVILGWDKSINDKWWACVDYAGGYSSIGALFAGGTYYFTPNVSLLVAYGKYNNGACPTITTQLDVNL